MKYHTYSRGSTVPHKWLRNIDGFNSDTLPACGASSIANSVSISLYAVTKESECELSRSLVLEYFTKLCW
jgi:hypothetical protein